jgi:outer membrane protein OmpA-like peptidoglycan-associated protein/tetratricopeptide (TPR) repeat protein
MLKTIFFLIFSSTFALTCFGQENLYYGNDAFSEGSYSQAIRLYEKAFEQKRSYEAASMLGRAYDLTHSYRKAEEWYRKAVNITGSNDTLYPYFANVLRLNAKYDEAKMYYEILAKKDVEITDKWNLYIESCSNAEKILYKKTTAKVVSIANLNDSTSDFPSYVRANQVFMASNRPSSKPEYKLFNPENDLPYYSVYNAFVSNAVAREFSTLETSKQIPSHEGPMSLTADNQAFLTVNTIAEDQQPNSRQLDIYIGVLNPGTNKIADLAPFEYNTDEFSEGQAHISADGKRLYFVSNGPKSYGGTDIFMCNRNGKGWTEPTNLGPEVNSIYDEFFPYELSATELYFSSNRPMSFGGLDIFASRLVKNYWEEPTQLPPPINSSRDDFAMVFGATANEGYFASNREGGQGQDDIYGFVLPETIFIENAPDSILVQRPVKKVVKPMTEAEIVADLEKEKSLQIKELKLEANPEDTLFTLTGKVQQFVDALRQPYDNSVIVIIIDTCGTQKKTKTNNEGEFKFEQVDDQTYIIRASKDDFFTNTLEVVVTPPDIVSVIDDRNLLENIEYEFNSFNLDPIAQSQLNKIAAVMKGRLDYKIDLKSYTDARGSDQYNLMLSKKRAASVRTYLISKGISSARIMSRGLGEANLIVKNANTNEQHRLNRRTEFKWIIAK